MKKGILVTFSAVFLGLALAFFIFSKGKTDEGKNVFNSSFYQKYREKMGDFTKKHPLYPQRDSFNPDLQSLISELQNPVSPEEARSSHERFVTKLRLLSKERLNKSSTLEKTPNDQFLEDLVNWIFLKADLKEALQEYLYGIVPSPTTKENISAYLQNTPSYLKKLPNFQGLEHPPHQEDPYIHGNLPFFQFQRGSTKVIRLGAPLTQGSSFFHLWQTVEVNPEFLLFLKVQPSHLYVNLMKSYGLEKASTQAIEKLELQFPHLYVITLDKNSPFYFQDKTPEKWEASLFKNQFLEKMIDPNGNYSEGNYYWSQHLEKGAWEKELKGLIDQVHGEYFSFQTPLTQEERQVFIELTYLAILDALVNKWSPASLNITCLQSIDRGPSLSVLWMLQKNNGTFKEQAALLLAPPLLIRNRTSQPRKISRLISSFEMFSKKQYPDTLQNN